LMPLVFAIVVPPSRRMVFSSLISRAGAGIGYDAIVRCSEIKTIHAKFAWRAASCRRLRDISLPVMLFEYMVRRLIFAF